MSIVDASVESKLAVLEDTIGKYFWKDVEEETLEDGLYRGLLDSLEDPYSVYYTNEELLALQQQTERRLLWNRCVYSGWGISAMCRSAR